jgi:enoyl-CoA hydratase/carnithine racemase
MTRDWSRAPQAQDEVVLSAHEHSHREAEGLAACAATEDHFEGLNAFLEKRPAFKGR